MEIEYTLFSKCQKKGTFQIKNEHFYNGFMIWNVYIHVFIANFSCATVKINSQFLITVDSSSVCHT